MDYFKMQNEKNVYCYVPSAVKENPGKKVPLVLFMCGTDCDPVKNMVDSGWTDLAEKENFIVISPEYNNHHTYSETDAIISVVKYMLANYPVDPERVYSTGFSNGGATSIALTRDYPQYFAGISAMGWMIGLDNKDGVYEAYDMPFQVIQGSGEYTEKTESGAMAVMDDEKEGLRDLLLYNEMISTEVQTDYDRTPYWGYVPDEMKNITMNGREWTFSNYYKEGFHRPFAQLVLVEDEKHRTRPEEAEIVWEFFRHFRRTQDGITEINGPIE